MNQPLKIATYCLLFFVYSISHAADLLPPKTDLVPHKATYTTQIEKGIKLKGTAVRQLKQLKDGRWQYKFDVDSFAAEIKESVIFNWTDNRVKPLDYRYELSGMFIKDRTQKVHFDWTKQQALGEHNGKKWQLALQNNALDRLGYQLQLLMDVQRPEQLKQKAPVEYQIIHKKKYRPSIFVVEGIEKLSTQHGELETVKVIKQRDKSKTRQTYLWFSKDYPELLVKMIQVEEDGERYEIEIGAAEIDGEKVFQLKSRPLQAAFLHWINATNY